MNQKDLTNAINQKLGTIYGSNVKRVEDTLKALGEIATDTLKSGGEVPFPALGKLVVVATKARQGRNPKTGAAIEIPAGRKAKFKVDTGLTEALKG